MSDQLSMFSRLIWPDLSSAISLQASAGGRMLLRSLAGLQTGKSGPEVVPVSRGVLRGGALAPTISATFGLRGSSSSKSASLQSSMENKLRAQMVAPGWIEPMLTWKVKTTPSHRRVFARRVSALHMTAHGCSLLPRPAAREGRDWSQARILARLDRGGCVARRICSRSAMLRLSKEIVGLSPYFAAWMMGYPLEWNSCAVSATPLSRKSRKPSSKRTAPLKSESLLTG